MIVLRCDNFGLLYEVSNIIEMVTPSIIKIEADFKRQKRKNPLTNFFAIIFFYFRSTALFPVLPMTDETFLKASQTVNVIITEINSRLQYLQGRFDLSVFMKWCKSGDAFKFMKLS